MSMDAMARDMRNRFVVALMFTVPVVLWSNVGKNLLGSELATPFGMDRDVWAAPGEPADRLLRLDDLLRGGRHRTPCANAGHDVPGPRRDRHRVRTPHATPVVVGRPAPAAPNCAPSLHGR
jgi:hypothetical protein